MEALKTLLRVVESTVVMATSKLYDSDAKGGMASLKMMLKHNSLRKLHVHNCIFM